MQIEYREASLVTFRLNEFVKEAIFDLDHVVQSENTSVAFFLTIDTGVHAYDCLMRADDAHLHGRLK